MKIPWISDPKGEPSVSLTLMLVFGVASLGANALAVFKQVQSTAGLDNLFFSAVALYFSRRNITVGKNTYSAADAEQVKEKIDG